MFRVVSVFVFFSFFFALSLLAQDIEFQGVVLDSEDGKRIGGAEVLNLRTHQRISTNSMGVFVISGRVSDSVKVWKSNYTEGVSVIQPSADIIVRLKPAIMLREVNVYGETKEKQLQDVMQDFRKQGVFYNGKPPALSYIFTPITALHELLGKAPKNARRFQRYMNIELEQTLVDQKFNMRLIQSVTGLTGEDLINFMSLYRPSFRTAEHWNDYDVRTYIKSSFDQFEASGRPAAPKLPKLEIPPQEK